jgi:XTP/dITP diphosphohydrolase
LPSGLGALRLERLVLATTNKGKVREIRELLTGIGLDIVGLEAYPAIPPVEENGRSFRENAVIKAKTVAAYTRELTLADDSGLEVDGLSGEPGIYSARYGKPGWTDRQRFEYLLVKLAGVAKNERTARFRSAVAIYDPMTERLETAEGTVEGVIIDTPRGNNGFGYDPVFFLPELGKTMAELTDGQKNGLSHRGRAITAIIPKLRGMLDGVK